MELVLSVTPCVLCVESEIHAVSEQRHKKRLGDLRRQLRSLEQEQLKLEAKGIELERKLRTKVKKRLICADFIKK